MPGGTVYVLPAGGSVEFKQPYQASYYWLGMTPVQVELGTNYSDCKVVFGVDTGSLVAGVYEHRSPWDYTILGIGWGGGSLAILFLWVMLRKMLGSGKVEL